MGYEVLEENDSDSLGGRGQRRSSCFNGEGSEFASCLLSKSSSSDDGCLLHFCASCGCEAGLWLCLLLTLGREVDEDLWFRGICLIVAFSTGVPTASFGAAPKRSESSSGYSRRGETQEDWQGWFRGIGFVVFEVLSRPEVWLLLLVLGFLLNQLVQQARDIMLTQMQEEKLQRRQQILQRYGVEEEEEEIESVGAADEKDSADSSGEAKEETERVEALRSSLQHSKPAEEHS